MSLPGLDATKCTVLEQLRKVQTTTTSVQGAIDNIAAQYRVLLNTILRVAVESTWALAPERKAAGPTSSAQGGCRPAERDEMLRLKLLNAELKEQLSAAIKDVEQHKQQLAFLVGDPSECPTPTPST
jgi:hypothetical protein